MTRRKLGLSPRTKGYIEAVLVGLPFIGGIVFLMINLTRGISSIFSILVIFIFLSPLIIVGLYAMYRALVPVTGGMPLKRFRQWAMLYPFLASFGLLWAFLAWISDIYVPFFSREDREFTLPWLIILGITLVLTLTRLRYKVADFLNKMFGTEPTKEPNENKGVLV